jgi:hypothetical protein
MQSKFESSERLARKNQKGVSLLGLIFWAIFLAFFTVVGLKVLPTVGEYFTIKKAVKKIAVDGALTVPEVRTAFERQKAIDEMGSLSSKDLEITKENDKLVIKFAYEKQIEVMAPVFLLIKYEGSSK